MKRFAWLSGSTPGSRVAAIGSIGLEFAREKLHLVQLQRLADGRLTLRARASVPYPEDRTELMTSPARLKALLARAFKGRPFHGREVTTALPAGDIRILSVSYAAGDDRDADAAIARVMESRLPEPLANYVIDYLPVRATQRDGERLSVVAVAGREAVVDYLELLRRAALSVRSLEIGPAAIKRLVSAMSDLREPDNVLVINFGEEVTYLTMISGRRLLLDQEVAFGERRLLAQIADTLEVSAEEARTLVYDHVLREPSRPGAPQGPDAPALNDNDVTDTLLEIIRPCLASLVEEIKRTLMYAAAETHGQAARRVYLVGSLARWRGVDRALNDMIDIEVANIPDPLVAFTNPAAGAGETAEPEIAVATGLALRDMFEHG